VVAFEDRKIVVALLHRRDPRVPNGEEVVALAALDADVDREAFADCDESVLGGVELQLVGR